MKIQFKNIGFFVFILICGIAALSSCRNDEWSRHYSMDKAIGSDSTLWQIIKSNPELSKFAVILEKTGYNDVLSASKMYTVWAPLNSDVDTAALLKMDKKTLIREFVENHITRTSFPLTGISKSKIGMINKKILEFNPVDSTFGHLNFGYTKAAKNNFVAKNGILHTIDKTVPFPRNIWEYLSVKDFALDSVSRYLHSFDTLYFDERNSVPGDVDDQGRTVYLDSVVINFNPMFWKIGAVNNEDSSYTAILPTNAAWVKSYNTISPYFRYYRGKKSDTQYTADTLRRNQTMNALVKDLVFTQKNQDITKVDTAYSTSRTKISNPNLLIDGNARSIASNGHVYITDELKYKHWETWNPTITCEAEIEKYFTSSTMNTKVFLRKYEGNDPELRNRVSKDGYIKLTTAQPASQPTATFTIPNTLAGQLDANGQIIAGAAYNIYCVFLPATVENPLASSLPAKVKFELFHMSEAGVVPSSTSPVAVYDNNKQFFPVEKDKITKVLVASNVTFPYSEYGLIDSKQTVKLKVTNAVTTTEANNKAFTKEMFIDCIILEPVH